MSESLSWIFVGDAVEGTSFIRLVSESGSRKFCVFNYWSEAIFDESVGGEYLCAPAR